MKTQQTDLCDHKKDDTKKVLIIGSIILFLQLIFHLTVGASGIACLKSPMQDSIKVEVNNQLNRESFLKTLNYPNTVKRFYALNKLETTWLRPEQNIAPTASAMLLLDCVKQYGLQHQNYHPEVLSYTLMHDVLDSKSSISVGKKVEFELMLTDAMISMINHLHYGRLNPSLDACTLDNSLTLLLRAEELLLRIANSPNLMDSITNVQPKIIQYKQLQGYMKLIAGQYTCDSYETPEPELRAIAFNMERLRWNNLDSQIYLLVNIPSFQLAYVRPDSIRLFKVVTGKPSTPTPTLMSQISYIETAPDWKIPNRIFIKELLPIVEKNLAYFENNHMAVYDDRENMVEITAASLAEIKKQPKKYHARQTAGCDNALGKVVFRFENNYGVYLHDTPEQQYFKRSRRALSHGCIRVEDAENLARLLLGNDGQLNKLNQMNTAMSTYKKQNFRLQTPIPILITYLTVTVEDGLLAKHEDTYKLDKALEEKMYVQPEQLTTITLKK